MSYVDGFLIPVPKDNKEAYREQAAMCAEIFKELGALSVVECWGDDVPKGKTTDFWMAVKAEQNEAVVFSWIVWPSKAARDAGNKKMMEDARIKEMKMPFDEKRMIFGGFDILTQA